MAERSTKKVYLAGGLVPRKSVQVITAPTQFADTYFEFNQIYTDTRHIFHVKQIQASGMINLPIIVECSDANVFLLLLPHYKNLIESPAMVLYIKNIFFSCLATVHYNSH